MLMIEPAAVRLIAPIAARDPRNTPPRFVATTGCARDQLDLSLQT
jgi:hypothetical protein